MYRYKTNLRWKQVTLYWNIESDVVGSQDDAPVGKKTYHIHSRKYYKYYIANIAITQAGTSNVW